MGDLFILFSSLVYLYMQSKESKWFSKLVFFSLTYPMVFISKGLCKANNNCNNVTFSLGHYECARPIIIDGGPFLQHIAL